jgi:ParB family chromosome partitioning protein
MNSDQLNTLGTSPEIILVPGSIKGAVKAAEGSSRDLWYVKRSAIRIIDDFNIRLVKPRLLEHRRILADSMKEMGFKPEHPLVGYVANENDVSVIYLTGGHNRIAAYDMAISEGAELAEELPMVLKSKGTSLEDLTGDIGAGNLNLELEPLEKAFLAKRCKSFGWDNERIATRIGVKSPNYIDELLILAGAPASAIQMVAEDKVSAATAIEMLKKHGNLGPEKMQQGLQLAQSQGKEKLTKRFTTDPGLKFVTRSAPTLFTTVKEISADPAFAQLDAGLRDKVQKLMDEIAELQAKASKPKEPKAAKAPKEPKPPKAAKAPKEPKAPKAAVKKTFVSRPKKSKSEGAPA